MLVDAVRGAARWVASKAKAEFLRTDVPLRRRLWLYRNGFRADKDALYDLTDESVDQYLSDLQWRSAVKINEPYDIGLRNKLFFQKLVADHYGELLPPIYGVVRDGEITSNPFFAAVESVEQLVERAGDEPVMIKPVARGSGVGVHLLDATTGEMHIDGEPATRADLTGLLRTGEDLILGGYVAQSGYASEVFSEATNTIRVLVMVDPRTGDPFVAQSIHRFGTAASVPRDNVAAGGVCAKVDTETGKLGPVLTKGSGGIRWRETHPTTGAPITGTSVPAWTDIRDRVLEVTATFESLWPYVGWDIAVTDDAGSFEIIEGNRHPDVTEEQVIEPLLADDRVRRFYAHHDVV